MFKVIDKETGEECKVFGTLQKYDLLLFLIFNKETRHWDWREAKNYEPITEEQQERETGKFRQIEIDIKGCQSEEHFYEIAKWMAKGLQEKCGCLFSMFEQPEGCRESGDYCEDCFKDNVHIYSEELDIEFDEW